MSAEPIGCGRVVVIGGGLAGITAALDCARRRRGGDAARGARTARRRRLLVQRDELTVDNGQHVFLRCCTAYRELLEQLGATELVTLQPRLDIPVLAPGGRPVACAARGCGRRCTSPARCCATRYLGVRERVVAGLGDAARCGSSTSTIRPTTQRRSVTGCGAIARAAGRSTRSGS